MFNPVHHLSPSKYELIPKRCWLGYSLHFESAATPSKQKHIEHSCSFISTLFLHSCQRLLLSRLLSWSIVVALPGVLSYRAWRSAYLLPSLNRHACSIFCHLASWSAPLYCDEVRCSTLLEFSKTLSFIASTCCTKSTASIKPCKLSRSSTLEHILAPSLGFGNRVAVLLPLLWSITMINFHPYPLSQRWIPLLNQSILTLKNNNI